MTPYVLSIPQPHSLVFQEISRPLRIEENERLTSSLDLPRSGGAPSVSSVASSTRSASKKIKRDEPCLITKQYGYSLELINAAP
jgi:hypothetical protein